MRNSPFRRFARLARSRKGIRPEIRAALDWPAGERGLREVYPFRKSWIAIGILLVFDVIFLYPAIGVFAQALAAWQRLDDLFDLVTAVFMTAWLLGWSIGPLLMTTILLLMLFGREVISARSGMFRIFIGLPVIGIAADYRVESMRNLRFETPPKKSGHSWRGPHFVFDYGPRAVAFGSQASGSDLGELRNEIQGASGRQIRKGDATPEELEAHRLRDERPVVVDHAPQQPPPKPLAPLKWSSPTALALILANLVPVAGAMYLDWNLGEVMVLYWAESGIIGLFNIAKMAVISGWMALLSGTFFLAHYGAFMAVHFLFIWGIFVKGFEDSSGGDLAEVGRMFVHLWPALAALFISHGISFFRNFIGRGEYIGREVRKQMAEPYARIVMMHLVLIFGGGLSIILGGPTAVLLLVIAGKIWFDVRAHIKQHRSST